MTVYACQEVCVEYLGGCPDLLLSALIQKEHVEKQLTLPLSITHKHTTRCDEHPKQTPAFRPIVL